MWDLIDRHLDDGLRLVELVFTLVIIPVWRNSRKNSVKLDTAIVKANQAIVSVQSLERAVDGKLEAHTDKLMVSMGERFMSKGDFRMIMDYRQRGMAE